MRSLVSFVLAALLSGGAASAQTETAPRRLLDALEALREAPRWQTRLEAAVALGTFEDGRATRHLIKALQDPHFAVRAAAIRALVRLQDPRAVPDLLEGLTDEEPFVRTEARRAISRFDLDAARPYLVRALRRHPDARVKMIACERLAEQPDAATVEVLLDAAGDPPPVGRYAVGVLAALPLPQATRAFMLGLEHRDYVVQVASIEGLADLDDPDAVEPLVAKLDARVPDVVLAAMRSLATLKAHIDGRKYRVIARRARDRSARVRALRVLGVLGDEEDRRLLLSALDDEDVVVRGAAVTALGLLEEPRALPKLKQMRTSQDNARILSSLKATLRRLQESAEPADPDPTARRD